MIQSIWNFILSLWPEPLRLVLFVVGIMSFVGLNAAYLVWVERKGAARFQRRPGPTEVGWAGLLQPIADAAKLMSKQLIVPAGVDCTLFRVAPLLMMSPALMSLAVIPWGQSLAARNINVGLLMIFAFGSDQRHGHHARRLVLAEQIRDHLRRPRRLPERRLRNPHAAGGHHHDHGDGHDEPERDRRCSRPAAFWHWNLFRVWVNPLMPVTFLIFYTCMLAETNRAPFDMAEAESELVAGAYTEYSGMGFGVFFMAEYANILLGCALATVLFLGGWQSPIGDLLGNWQSTLGVLLGCSGSS